MSGHLCTAGHDVLGDRIWCSEVCTITGKCQRLQAEKYDRLYSRLQQRHRDREDRLGQGESCLPCGVMRGLFDLYTELVKHLNPNNLNRLDVTDAYPGIEEAVPYVKRNSRAGRWLLEVAYHTHRAGTDEEDRTDIPLYVVHRAIDIANALTHETAAGRSSALGNLS